MNNYYALEKYLITSAEKGELTFKREHPLSSCCSFKIGGSASFVIYPNDEKALITLIEYLHQNSIYHAVLGNASNVLFSSDGFDGAVIFTSRLNSISVDGDLLTAGAGVPLTQLSVYARRHSLSGLEFTYGIPGSVGGAVYMNAGAYDGEMKNIVVSSRYYDPVKGVSGEYKGTENQFGYRRSVYIGTTKVILSAVMKMKFSDITSLTEKMDAYMKCRIEKQPLEYPSAGSVFKRYPGYYTGKIIEESGLMGKTVGGAQVSEKHAGFIINRGGATSGDVLELISIINTTIYKNYGIELECEIRYIPPNDAK